MILNEDYFDKLELTDDDISGESQNEETEDINKFDSPEKLLEYYNSQYDTALWVIADKLQGNPNAFGKINMIISRVSYLLDIFGIRHSEFIVLDGLEDYYELDDREDYYIPRYLHNFDKYKFIAGTKHKERIFTSENRLSDFAFFDKLYVITFIDFSQFDREEIKKFVCKFLGCLYKMYAKQPFTMKLIREITLSKLPIKINDFRRRWTNAISLDDTLKVPIFYKDWKDRHDDCMLEQFEQQMEKFLNVYRK